MILTILVKANSKKGPVLEEVKENNFIAYIRQPAVDNRANQALIRLISKKYKVSKTKIEITKGLKSKHKQIDIG